MAILMVGTCAIGVPAAPADASTPAGSPLTVTSARTVGRPEAVPAALTTPTPACDLPAISLTNGSFEQPEVSGSISSTLPEEQVPGWRTNAPDRRIEVWPSTAAGYAAVDGDQWAEVNGDSLDTLYQDVATEPGAIVDYVVFHRGRSDINTAQIQFGPPDGEPNFTQNMTDGTTAWGYYVGRYQIPAGQSTTRFAFAALSGSGPNESIGNFLDAVHFGTPGCGETEVSAIDLNGGTLRPGDLVEYTLTAVNAGGVAVAAPLLHGPIPAGTSYLPGSMMLIDGDNATALSDADDGDQGAFDADGVRVDVGGALRDLLLSGRARQVTYRVRVNAEPTVDSIDLQSSFRYDDVVDSDQSTVYSNIVRLPLDLPAPPSPSPSPSPNREPIQTPVPSSTALAVPPVGPHPQVLSESGTKSAGLALAAGLAILLGVAALAARRWLRSA